MERAEDDLYLSPACHIWKDFFGFIQTDCDSGVGMSGGPFVSSESGIGKIWAVNSFSFEIPFKKWNFLSHDFKDVAFALIKAEAYGSIERYLAEHSKVETYIIPDTKIQ